MRELAYKQAILEAQDQALEMDEDVVIFCGAGGFKGS